jgi:hypothetical protein
MNAIEPNAVTDLFFQLNWSSGDIRHTDAYAGRTVNFWRDLLPGRLKDALAGRKPGDRIDISFEPGELFQEGNRQKPLSLYRHQFDPERIAAPGLLPRMGRFYPKGLLKDVAGIFRANREPFRCVHVNNGRLEVDLGHPLADRALSLSVTVGTVNRKKEERGGGSRDWMETVTQGVGMQAPWRGRPTDFFSGTPFAREDETDDAAFYAAPRMVQHLDDAASDLVREIYGRFMRKGMRVLDLMSSWQSHLPEGIALRQVTGIGLNAHELRHNDALSDYRVHDLNADPTLPLPDQSYDVAVCTASVEYLTAPMAVFAQVARVLRPGGVFIATFSNRWFPPKAISLWTQLHDFERMGLVLAYFQESGAFNELQTYSVRGLDRPRHDKYYGQLWQADPVYAVWGRRA